MREYSSLRTRRILHPDPETFTFPNSCTVTVTFRGTVSATISVTFPGGQPFSIATTQSFALSRALTEAIKWDEGMPPAD